MERKSEVTIEKCSSDDTVEVSSTFKYQDFSGVRINFGDNPTQMVLLYSSMNDTVIVDIGNCGIRISYDTLDALLKEIVDYRNNNGLDDDES